MRFAWVGVHAEGLPALEALLRTGAPIRGVLTLTPELAAAKGGNDQYAALCRRHGIPLYHVANINDPLAHEILAKLAPDVALVIGWHQVVRPATLRLARLGMIGAHASLLPANRGSAPVNWAIIRGQRETGNTLFWLADELDAGDLIDQAAFPITPYDTCATVYDKVAASNRDMLLSLMPRLLAGERPGRPHPASTDPVLPRRRPADGGIRWSQSNQAVYDFIRALTRPYPGAFSTLEGRRWFIWRAALPPGRWPAAGLAGTVLGPVVSPASDACGQLVACGEGGVILLEVEAKDGTILRGPDLSDQPWAGKQWTDD